MANERDRIGEILVRRRKIQPYQLAFLLDLQKTSNDEGRKVMIGDLLVKHRAITELSLLETLAQQEAFSSDGVTEVIEGIFDEQPNKELEDSETINDQTEVTEKTDRVSVSAFQLSEADLV